MIANRLKTIKVDNILYLKRDKKKLIELTTMIRMISFSVPALIIITCIC